MSNNNKWEALSLRDRAFLIRESVKNGVTSLDEIRNTWEHRFDGESNQPTENEYIEQRARAKRLEALEHALNRKKAIIPLVRKSENYKRDEEEALKKTIGELNTLNRELSALQATPYKGIQGKYNPNTKQIEYSPMRTAKQVEKEIADKESLLQTQLYHCNQDHVHGFGCLATVMDDYGKTETWNERFAKNPRVMGFVEINDSDILPGDIVQFGSSYQDFQTGESGIDFNHAMMANTPYNKDISKMRYNGSNGGDTVRINSKYPSHWEETVGYRFVGDKADSLQWKKEYREKYGHQFSGEDDTQEKPWYKKAWDAISEGGRMARELYKQGESEKAQELAKQYAKANIAGTAMAAGVANPFGIAGDLGITLASTVADTAVDGNTDEFWKNLGYSAAADLTGGMLQWLPKMVKGGKQAAKNIKKVKEDFIVKPSIPKVKKMTEDSKWYNFPNGYEFHFAEATPKNYMGELFYAPALEKSKARTAEINKTSFLDMISKGQRPQSERDYIRLDTKTLDDVMNEPASLYVSSSPTRLGGYDGGQLGSNADVSNQLPSHTTLVHEKKHAVQRATNAGNADIVSDALVDYRRFPKHDLLKSGYHEILSDQADFLKELDTGLMPGSTDNATNLIFKENDSRNIRELNATAAESLYKMFKNRLPYADERFMTKELLDLYKTEIAEMTSEEFIKEFSKDANAYARDYLRGIEEIKKKDPARAEYLTKRLKDLVINQYF